MNFGNAGNTVAAVCAMLIIASVVWAVARGMKRSSSGRPGILLSLAVPLAPVVFKKKPSVANPILKIDILPRDNISSAIIAVFVVGILVGLGVAVLSSVAFGGSCF
ncbi:MAG: hypothetical protein WC791_03185 [Candidatus Paceibacterota bacterium]|jgi:hypothetical protein